MSECKHKERPCSSCDYWTDNKPDWCWLHECDDFDDDDCVHSPRGGEKCHYRAEFSRTERDSRHRAFTVKLVRGLVGLVNMTAEEPLTYFQERGMRAARRWLAVVTKQ